MNHLAVAIEQTQIAREQLKLQREPSSSEQILEKIFRKLEEIKFVVQAQHQREGHQVEGENVQTTSGNPTEQDAHPN